MKFYNEDIVLFMLVFIVGATVGYYFGYRRAQREQAQLREDPRRESP